MAVTQSQSIQSASVPQIAVGRYLDDGTAAVITITTGFTPRYVHIINNASSDELEWVEGMAAASGLKRVAGGTGSAITTLGITQASNGFTIGLDTDINVSNEQLSWIALG